jgi:CheY-like chemotaxis protein
MPEEEEKKYVVMTVDDSSLIRKILKTICEKEGCEVVEAQNATEAIKRFQEEHIDFIFMDIMFPGKNGIEALAELKMLDPTVTVVMCTSIIGQEQVIEKSIEFGASEYITKPFQEEHIRSIIKKYRDLKEKEQKE